MGGFSLEQRHRWLQRSAEGLVDVLVVGGGITGAGVVREAALRGLTVVLVDKADFASGTSSRSSKLIHGGVRYLAQGDIALVREAARERSVLRAIAPHLARPVQMLIPTASLAGRLKLAAGLWTFDRVAGGAADTGHEVLDRRATCQAEPGLRDDRLAGSVVFTEYVTSDARLTLETIKSASEAGARVANYAAVVAMSESDASMRVVVEDQVEGEQLEIRARCVVNAAGPWFDEVRGLSEPRAEALTQLTRGIHLVVLRERLPVDNCVVLRSPDGRSTFVVPRGRFAYIGTTDTHYSGSLEEPGVSLADAEYLLESVAATFESAPGLDDIVGTWSGVRPLLKQEGKKPSEISRRDEIHSGPGPIVGVAGGKLTTYRCMAERVVVEVLRIINKTPTADIDSARLALVGGDAQQQDCVRARTPSSGDARLDERLWSTYGVAAAEIISRMVADSHAVECPGGLDGLSYAEIDHAIEEEMAWSLDDVLRRRSHLAMFDIAAATNASGEVARHMAAKLGWSERRCCNEIEEFERARRSELDIVRGRPRQRDGDTTARESQPNE